MYIIHIYMYVYIYIVICIYCQDGMSFSNRRPHLRAWDIDSHVHVFIYVCRHNSSWQATLSPLLQHSSVAPFEGTSRSHPSPSGALQQPLMGQQFCLVVVCSCTLNVFSSTLKAQTSHKKTARTVYLFRVSSLKAIVRYSSLTPSHSYLIPEHNSRQIRMEKNIKNWEEQLIASPHTPGHQTSRRNTIRSSPPKTPKSCCLCVV